MRKILLVEDDFELNKTLCYALSQKNYQITAVSSIAEAKEKYRKVMDLVLLDVNLPDGEGFSFCEWVKKQKEVPVLFLTARDLEEDALKGYDVGADDYVVKPFSIKVLLKKIEIILKKSVKEAGIVYDDGNLQVDLENARVMKAGKDCAVTPTEMRLLKQLILHKGQLLTYEILLERLWDNGGRFVDKHALAVNINRLRGKIEDEDHRYISNIYGMGYQWIGE